MKTSGQEHIEPRTPQAVDTLSRGHSIGSWTKRAVDTAGCEHCGPWTQRVVNTAGRGQSEPWTQRVVNTADCGQSEPWTHRVVDTASRGHSWSCTQHRVMDSAGCRHSEPWTKRAVVTPGRGQWYGQRDSVAAEFFDRSNPNIVREKLPFEETYTRVA